MEAFQIRILAVDQAKKGAWSVWDYERKELVSYGTFEYTSDVPYEKAIVGIVDVVDSAMRQYDAAAVFIEDVQLRKDPQAFKKLAQLQGALAAHFERNELLYDYIMPSQWQNYCGARGRTTAEIKKKITKAETKSGKPASKILSIEYVKEKHGIETDNDNLSDAICIGEYVVNNVVIRTATE